MQRVKNPNEFVPLWEVTYVSSRVRKDGSRPIVVVTLPANSRQQAIEGATTPAHFGGSCRDNVCDVRQVTWPAVKVAA